MQRAYYMSRSIRVWHESASIFPVAPHRFKLNFCGVYRNMSRCQVGGLRGPGLGLNVPISESVSDGPVPAVHDKLCVSCDESISVRVAHKSIECRFPDMHECRVLYSFDAYMCGLGAARTKRPVWGGDRSVLLFEKNKISN